MKLRKRSPKTSINWDHFASLASKWEDSVIDNIDEEYNRLVDHLHDSARKAESSHQQTSELAKLCREDLKDDLTEGRAAVMDEKCVRKARRSFANCKTKMTSPSSS
uniref:Mitochondrial import inner membrane translocase subunit n=1 Tax=Haemonchus contortus TaxID=6289 RepID=A0A7I5EEU3_HAECO